ncbi:VanZ family protein [Bradyrhizobium sp. 179]|uniref:VanZ family protein n=1 Tax=Bradyrhizobium sp. 179 TaxID=2782648 RepID=UPI001FF72D33|nr:VanZ family protein [Bradyrhizobium sp. 179]MCK1541606.1 VanZ family protein [Bradyrhizobium sp. 179]
MLQRLSAAVAWAALAFITYASLSPIRDRPQLSNVADLEHLAAFALLGFAFCLSYRRRMTFVCGIVLGSAVVLEFLQTLTPDRHGKLLDASEKIIGGLIGIFLASLALRAMERAGCVPSILKSVRSLKPRSGA